MTLLTRSLAETLPGSHDWRKKCVNINISAAVKAWGGAHRKLLVPESVVATEGVTVSRRERLHALASCERASTGARLCRLPLASVLGDHVVEERGVDVLREARLGRGVGRVVRGAEVESAALARSDLLEGRFEVDRSRAGVTLLVDEEGDGRRRRGEDRGGEHGKENERRERHGRRAGGESA
jgi:hypothetical protein